MQAILVFKWELMQPLNTPLVSLEIIISTYVEKERKEK